MKKLSCVFILSLEEWVDFRWDSKQRLSNRKISINKGVTGLSMEHVGRKENSFQLDP